MWRTSKKVYVRTRRVYTPNANRLVLAAAEGAILKPGVQRAADGATLDVDLRVRLPLIVAGKFRGIFRYGRAVSEEGLVPREGKSRFKYLGKVLQEVGGRMPHKTKLLWFRYERYSLGERPVRVPFL